MDEILEQFEMNLQYTFLKIRFDYFFIGKSCILAADKNLDF